MKYKRVLLKLSGEALGLRGRQGGIGLDSADAIAGEIEAVSKAGAEVSVVIGGGNIFRGAVAAEGGAIEQAQADMMGMLATVINGLALQSALERRGLDARLLTAISMPQIAEPFIRRRALAHLARGRVLVFAGGTGSPFFSTDTAAALRAVEINAEVILKGTKVDGVYSADPVKEPKAERFDSLTFVDVLSRRLKVMDATAISMCMEHNLPIIVFDIFKPKNLMSAVKGEKTGTIIYG
ncbi:MAG: UMP kinase [Proteobacteria bacterium]|nr:UMP kinase [Pseudomonadota bacterium]